MSWQKIQFWTNTLKAQWQARREAQHKHWELKNVPPELVHKVADGMVHHAVEELKAAKMEGIQEAKEK